VVLGRTGFVGQLVEKAIREAGHQTSALAPFRVERAFDRARPLEECVVDWLGTHADLAGELAGQLSGNDVLVNAAGMAEPKSEDIPRLFDANAVLAGVAAQIASRAGVSRLIHISSAAVQGRRDPLDESEDIEPVTSYGRSKAAAERLLLERRVDVPNELIVYRPTSVQGVSRDLTGKLVAFASMAFVPIPGGGSAPVPVCLSENVAAVVVYLLSVNPPPRIVLQPPEGMTTRGLLNALGNNPRFVPFPGGLARAAVELGYLLGRRSSRVGALARRLDLLVNGQEQDARALAHLGFDPPNDAHAHAYRQLGEKVRRAALNKPAPEMLSRASPGD